jgi:hypothetical protein
MSRSRDSLRRAQNRYRVRWRAAIGEAGIAQRIDALVARVLEE